MIKPILRNNIPILLLCFFMILKGLYYLNYYYVVDPDFLGIVTNVRLIKDMSFSKFYENFESRRMPFFPFLIAIFSEFIKSSGPEFLFTAQILNLILSATALLLVYLVCFQFIKEKAFFVVFFLSLERNMFDAMTQPLVYMLLLNLVTLGLYLAIINSRKIFFVSFLSGLTQPTGVSLAITAFINTFIRSKEKIKTIFLFTLSLSGLLAWVILCYLRYGEISPYLTEMMDIGSISGINFIRETLKLLSQTFFGDYTNTYFSFILFTVAILIFSGAVLISKEHRLKSLPILLFLLFYTLIHMFFPMIRGLYIVPIVWIYYLLLIYPVIFLSKKLDKPHLNKIPNILFIFASLAVIIVIIWYNFNSTKSLGLDNIFYWLWFSSAFIYLFCRKSKKTEFLFSLLIFLFLCSITINSIMLTNDLIFRQKYFWAEVYEFAKWFPHNLKPNSIIITPAAPVVSYYCNIPICKQFEIIDDSWLVNIEENKQSRFCDSNECFINILKQFDKNQKLYLTLPSLHVNLQKEPWFKKFNPYYYGDAINEYKNNFKLIKKLEKGPTFILVYEFVN